MPVQQRLKCVRKPVWFRLRRLRIDPGTVLETHPEGGLLGPRRRALPDDFPIDLRRDRLVY